MRRRFANSGTSRLNPTSFCTWPRWRTRTLPRASRSELSSQPSARSYPPRAATDGDRLRGLQGLDTTEEVGSAYLGDLEWALSFARANRKALLSKALEVISDALRVSLETQDVLDIHHNFVAREKWFGRDLL